MEDAGQHLPIKEIFDALFIPVSGIAKNEQSNIHQKQYKNMEKKEERALCVPITRKLKRIMRLTTLFSLGVACCISASTYAQDYKLSMNKQNSSIIEILKDIEEKSEFTFFFNDNHVNVNQKASINVKDATLEEALAQVLKNTGYSYQIIDRQVLIKAGTSTAAGVQGVQQDKRTITGHR